MKEGVASNLNYNIAYWFFLASLLYHSQHINDFSTLLLLGLTLTSFTAVVEPQKHKKIHILIALVASFDLIIKILISQGVIKGVSSTFIDLKIIKKMMNL